MVERGSGRPVPCNRIGRGSGHGHVNFMKILYHHRTTARDGSAVHINGLIDALQELGVEVQVVAPKIVGK